MLPMVQSLSTAGEQSILWKLSLQCWNWKVWNILYRTQHNREAPLAYEGAPRRATLFQHCTDSTFHALTAAGNGSNKGIFFLTSKTYPLFSRNNTCLFIWPFWKRQRGYSHSRKMVGEEVVSEWVWTFKLCFICG